ncbi:MAG: hypothetical protein ACNA8S_15030 [Deferrisomatales bacterium]
MATFRFVVSVLISMVFVRIGFVIINDGGFERATGDSYDLGTSAFGVGLLVSLLGVAVFVNAVVRQFGTNSTAR